MPAGVVLTINAHIGAGGYDALNFVLAEHLHIKTGGSSPCLNQFLCQKIYSLVFVNNSFTHP